MIVNAVVKGGGGDDGITRFSFDGLCEIDNNILRIKTSGTLILHQSVLVDLFLCGGGAGGGQGYSKPKYSGSSATNRSGGHGGGGGHTFTQKKLELQKGTEYLATIGAGGASKKNGGDTSFLQYTATGGVAGGSAQTSYSSGTFTFPAGSSGGSGGGTGAVYYVYSDGDIDNYAATAGGTDGGNGGKSSKYNAQGIGQGTTTREFGDADGILYSTGGAGGAYNDNTYDAAADNTGNGGRGGGGNAGNTGNGVYTAGAAGGSGIISIRFPEGTELAQVA